MPREPSAPITTLLAAVADGNVAARERLWEAIYDELHHIAQRQLADDALRHTVQPTTLVHEAYIRLTGGDGAAAWVNRRHFFAAAARAMRHIRVDDARKRRRIKRGGDATGRRTDRCADDGPAEVSAPNGADLTDLLALDEALTKLEALDRRKAEIVTCRNFAGLSVEETAEALELSPRTVEADWRLARAWLHKELSGEQRAAG